MSIDATRWAWRQTGLSASQKITLLSLADRAGEGHECFPSISRLCADTGLDRKTVFAAIEAMQARGLIVVDKAIGTRNTYRLIGVESRETSADIGTSTKFGTSPKNGTPPVPKTVLDQSQKRDTHQYQKRYSNLPIEPINKPTTEPTSNKTRARRSDGEAKKPTTMPTPEGVPDQTWADYLAIRKAKRAPMTPTALAGLKREAEAAGMTLRRAVETCCERGWQSLRADWITAQPAKPRITWRDDYAEDRKHDGYDPIGKL